MPALRSFARLSVLACALFGTVLVSHAQEARTGFQVNVLGGIYLDTDQAARGYDQTVPILMASVQRPVVSLETISLEARVGASLMKANRHGCPPPKPGTPTFIGPEGWNKLYAGAAFAVFAELALSVELQRLRVEPFLGGGFRNVQEGSFDDTDDPEAIFIEGYSSAMATYGASVYLGLTDRIDALVQVRGFTYFLGDLTLTTQQRQQEERDFGTITNVGVLLGVAIRL